MTDNNEEKTDYNEEKTDDNEKDAFHVTTTHDELLSVQVEDQVHVGTERMLYSPHVSEGPGRIASAPVPSIYMDDRGEIHRIRVHAKRLNLLFSKKNVMRSGYIHPTRSCGYVVSGKVQIWTLSEHGTDKTVYEADQPYFTPPYTPHILHFLEDSVILEYWDGDFSCYYYHPYRVSSRVLFLGSIFDGSNFFVLKIAPLFLLLFLASCGAAKLVGGQRDERSRGYLSKAATRRRWHEIHRNDMGRSGLALGCCRSRSWSWARVHSGLGTETKALAFCAFFSFCR
jgi:hypothetical protein